MKIGISRAHFPVTTLGPGRRLGIWVQGCSIRCPGCISADTWREASDLVHVDTLVAQLSAWLTQCDGITISGGEPFDQPLALQALLQVLRGFDADGRTRDILVYSGHPIEHLHGLMAGCPDWGDALMTDPFALDQPQTKALRGSDNQRLHLLTPLGTERFAAYERTTRASDRQLDVMVDDTGVVWLAGIPSRGDMQRLQAVLKSQGHFSHTTEAPAPR